MDTLSLTLSPLNVTSNSSLLCIGFGGADAHAILEEHLVASTASNFTSSSLSFTPFVFSAHSDSSLRALLERYSDFLKTATHDCESESIVNTSDLAWTLHSRRSRLPVKVSFSARTIQQLHEKIDKKLASVNSNAGTTIIGQRAVTSTRQAPCILGVFTGQGA